MAMEKELTALPCALPGEGHGSGSGALVGADNCTAQGFGDLTSPRSDVGSDPIVPRPFTTQSKES